MTQSTTTAADDSDLAGLERAAVPPSSVELATLQRQLDAALAENQALKDRISGPAPVDYAAMATRALFVAFLDGVVGLLGAHPHIDEIWSFLRARLNDNHDAI